MKKGYLNMRQRKKRSHQQRPTPEPPQPRSEPRLELFTIQQQELSYQLRPPAPNPFQQPVVPPPQLLSAPPQAAQNAAKCNICLESEGVELTALHGSHMFCKSCICLWTSSKCDDLSVWSMRQSAGQFGSSSGIKCPFVNCTEHISVNELTEILKHDPDAHATYLAACTRSRLSVSHDFLPCPSCPGGGWLDSRCTVADTEVFCPDCDSPFQVHRDTIEHVVTTTAKPTGWLRKLLSWLPMRRSETPAPVSVDGTHVADSKSRLWIARMTQKCPKCHTATERVAGCPHLRCRCGHDWFWAPDRPFTEMSAESKGADFAAPLLLESAMPAFDFSPGTMQMVRNNPSLLQHYERRARVQRISRAACLVIALLLAIATYAYGPSYVLSWLVPRFVRRAFFWVVGCISSAAGFVSWCTPWFISRPLGWAFSVLFRLGQVGTSLVTSVATTLLYWTAISISWATPSPVAQLVGGVYSIGKSFAFSTFTHAVAGLAAAGYTGARVASCFR